MRSIHELRLAVTEYYFCGDRPIFFTGLGMEFIKFWDKLNARASRDMTKDEWEEWMKEGGHFDKRKCLTEKEFDALFQEARSLEIK